MRITGYIIGLLVATSGTVAIAQSPNKMLNTIFPVGAKTQGGNFKGTVWVTSLLTADSSTDVSVGNVIFEPKAHSKWHKHPGGQTLLVLNGVGYYQERGQPLQILHKGDVVKCPPEVEHWHGASKDNWFVQLALTKEHPKGRVIWLEDVQEAVYLAGVSKEQETLSKLNDLEARHQHIVQIASFTAKGDLEQLHISLNNALDAGLTVSEAKEILIHLYAYCGFPRSIQGLNTLMAVLDTRKAQGITERIGKQASLIDNTLSKYERGKKVLEALTGQTQITPPKSGYGAFCPEIDVFLKEHLFADIFERDVLTFVDRELATISALASLGGVEPMLKGHFGIALHLGISEAQLYHLLALIESSTGKAEVEVSRKVLSEVMASKK